MTARRHDDLENHDERERHLVETMDVIAERMRLWIGALVLVGTLIAGGTATAVRWVTSDVRRDIADTRLELRTYAATQRALAERDSARFERAMQVVELAVIALVEPAGSAEQAQAIRELRTRRHIRSW